MKLKEMFHGETRIKVHPSKVDEMLAKGWQIVDSTPEVVVDLFTEEMVQEEV